MLKHCTVGTTTQGIVAQSRGSKAGNQTAHRLRRLPEWFFQDLQNLRGSSARQDFIVWPNRCAARRVEDVSGKRREGDAISEGRTTGNFACVWVSATHQRLVLHSSPITVDARQNTWVRVSSRSAMCSLNEIDLHRIEGRELDRLRWHDPDDIWHRAATCLRQSSPGDTMSSAANHSAEGRSESHESGAHPRRCH